MNTTVKADKKNDGGLLKDFSSLSGRVGIFGGTFDPVHQGHVEVAEAAIEKFGLDTVIFMPTPRNPLKVVGPSASGSERLEMLLRALEGKPGLKVSTWELEQNRPAYTVELLRTVKREAKSGTELFFIGGMDAANNLHQWKDVHEALKLAHFVLADRPGCDYSALTKHFSPAEVDEITKRHIHIEHPSSSTSIRRLIAEGRVANLLIPQSVLEFIQDKGLYRNSTAGSIGDLKTVEASATTDSKLVAGAATQRVKETALGIANQMDVNRSTFKIAVAQIETRAGNLEFNYKKISAGINRAAREGAEAVVFPELATVGYCSMDLLKDPRYIEANQRMLRKICADSADLDVVIVVGCVDQGPEKGDGTRDYYNAAAVIHRGKIIDMVHKVLLPEEDIFFERRYFKSGTNVHPVNIKGNKVGLHICEDLWDSGYESKVCQELKEAGASMFWNLSGSPWHKGKYDYRFDLLSGKARQLHSPFLYCNTIGLQDGYDGEVLFDGRSMVFDADGHLCGQGKSFKEDFFMVDMHQPTRIAVPTWTAPDEIYDALLMGGRIFFERFGFKKAVIGISGGIDSAVTAALAVENFGPENVIGITMPSRITSKETYQDALDLCRNLGIKCQVRPIRALYRQWEKETLQAALSFSERLKYNAQNLLAKTGLVDKAAHPLHTVTRQNAQSRLRGFILMQESNRTPGSIVLDTGNRTEGAQNYWTYIGDGIGAVSYLADLDKYPEISDLAAAINHRAGKEIIPWTTIGRPPTAELEEGQTDEANLPAKYTTLGPLAAELVSRSVSLDELAQRYPEDVVDASVRRLLGSEWKRRQRPPAMRVHANTFGIGRRIPNSSVWPDRHNMFWSDASLPGVPEIEKLKVKVA